MPYRMKLIPFENDEIVSPIIACNSIKSEYGYEDRRIDKEINKTGRSMVKFKLIKSYMVMKTEEEVPI